MNDKFLKWFPGKIARDVRGFTLVEILVSMVVFIVGFLVYANVSGNIIHQNFEVKRKSTAITLAQDKLETIKNLSLTTSLAGADGLDSPTFSGGWSANAGGEVVDPQGNPSTPEAIYTRTWTISQDGTLFFYHTASVTVSWDGGANSVTLTTQISE